MLPVDIFLRLLLLLLLVQRIRVARVPLRVQVNATGDTVVLRFVRPGPDVKLEGFLLGYGSSPVSKQFIQLPEEGDTYETEMDAEPKYLLAVRPIPAQNFKKHCTGQVDLHRPPQLLIGPVSPTSVLLSWGNVLKTAKERDVMSECLEDGFYTVRYRERNRKWMYQTCPTRDTVVDNLKTDTSYEFSVRPNKDQHSGSWSRTVLHRTSSQSPVEKLKMRSPVMKSLKPPGLFPPRHALHNITRPPLTSLLMNSAFPGAPRTSFKNHPSYRGLSPKPALWSQPGLGSPVRPFAQINKKPNQVGKPGEMDKVNNFKHSDRMPILKPRVRSPPTAKPTKKETQRSTTTIPTTTATPQESWVESDLFKSQPASDLDAMGKKRFVAPHVVYQTGKKADEPCSITSSLTYFPEDEPIETNVKAPPRNPPSNVTVVTVEGCPSFVILDWDKTDNDTTEYEVISTAKGPDGEQVSIVTTNQTRTTVENLKPESSYEFKVKPKNVLGAGPPSEPVSFNTESADPRVSETISGKAAIWTQFPFKTDSYSDCHGKQFVKRTWYRKFVGIQLCNSLRYKIYLSDSLNGKFYNIGDQSGFGEDHCQFVDSFLDGRTGQQLRADQLQSRPGFYRALRQEPVHFGPIGGESHINYVSWYECGTPIPGKW